MKDEQELIETVRTDFFQAYSWYMNRTGSQILKIETTKKNLKEAAEGVADHGCLYQVAQKYNKLVSAERKLFSERAFLQTYFFEKGELTKDLSKLPDMYKLNCLWREKTGGVYPTS